MSEHKTTNLHPPPPLGSVANTLINQHHQKIESIDYTADESMIAVSLLKKIKKKEDKFYFHLIIKKRILWLFYLNLIQVIQHQH